MRTWGTAELGLLAPGLLGNQHLPGDRQAGRPFCRAGWELLSFRATRRGGGGSAGEAELSLKGQVPPSEASQREGCCTGVVSQEVGTRESVKAEKVNVKRSRALHGF